MDEQSEPNGHDLSEERIDEVNQSDQDRRARLQEFKSSFDACSNDGPLMIYICKLFVMKGIDIQSPKRKFDPETEYEIALCRSFSGRITTNSTLYVIPSTGELLFCSFFPVERTPINCSLFQPLFSCSS